MQSGNSRLNDGYFLAKWCGGRLRDCLRVVGNVVRLMIGYIVFSFLCVNR